MQVHDGQVGPPPGSHVLVRVQAHYEEAAQLARSLEAAGEAVRQPFLVVR